MEVGIRVGLIVGTAVGTLSPQLAFRSAVHTRKHIYKFPTDITLIKIMRPGRTDSHAPNNLLFAGYCIDPYRYQQKNP